MIKGTDICLDVCKAEGYTMIKFDGRSNFVPDKEYEFIQWLPEVMRADLKTKGYSNGEMKASIMLSRNEAWNLYLSRKNRIDSYTGEPRLYKEDIDDFYPLLWLVNDISSFTSIFKYPIRH